MSIKLRTLGIIFAIAVALGVAGGGLFVYFGVYNVAATEQHLKPVYQLLEYAMRRAVVVRTGDIPVPDLSDQQRVVNGARHYREQCLQCHGAPGVSPHDLAFGMTPEPVNLVSTAREWKPGEMFWVIKYGIKMSGMPAWNRRLNDEEIWDVVAFTAAMAHMTTKDYAALDEKLSSMAAREASPQPANVRTTVGSPTPMPAPAPADDPNPKKLVGNPEAGRRAIAQYLCATCHAIPGITGANRHVGPPLNGIADRRYIGGIIANTPENMVRWLMNPKQFDPLSTMPNLGVTEHDARDMTAYLYTLDDVN